MTNEAATTLYIQIQELVAENDQSVLNFEKEVTQANDLTQEQQAEINAMTTIHQEIKEVATSQTRVTASDLQRLKDEFSSHYAQYQENEEALRDIHTKLETAFDIENKIMKEYLLAESTKILEELIGKMADQDQALEQLEEDATQVFSEVEMTSEIEEAVSEVSEVVVEVQTEDINDKILEAQEALFTPQMSESTSVDSEYSEV